MKQFQRNQYNQLLEAVGNDVSLTEQERNTMKWIAGLEPQTVKNLSSVFIQLNEQNGKGKR